MRVRNLLRHDHLRNISFWFPRRSLQSNQMRKLFFKIKLLIIFQMFDFVLPHWLVLCSVFLVSRLRHLDGYLDPHEATAKRYEGMPCAFRLLRFSIVLSLLLHFSICRVFHGDFTIWMSWILRKKSPAKNNGCRYFVYLQRTFYSCVFEWGVLERLNMLKLALMVAVSFAFVSLFLSRINCAS